MKVVENSDFSWLLFFQTSYLHLIDFHRHFARACIQLVRLVRLGLPVKFKSDANKNFETMVHYMCFDKFLFWVESRDLSQADKSIIRVSSFPSWVMGSRTFFSVSTTEPWTFCKMNALNPLKFTSHKKNWENWGKKLKLIKTSILPNFQVPNSFFL